MTNDKNKPEVEGEVCECGHKEEKHRSRGSHSCLRCDCRRYKPATLMSDGRIIPVAHPPNCLCGRCAWERLFNSERLGINNSSRIKKLEDENKRLKDINEIFKNKIDECALTINAIINAETAPMFSKKEFVEALREKKISMVKLPEQLPLTTPAVLKPQPTAQAPSNASVTTSVQPKTATPQKQS